MKKKYLDPEFELIKLQLSNRLLAISDSNKTGEGDVGDVPINLGDEL